MVSSNLTKKIALGPIAGPFQSPHFLIQKSLAKGTTKVTDKNIVEYYRYFTREDTFNIEHYLNAKHQFLNAYSQSLRERT